MWGPETKTIVEYSCYKKRSWNHGLPWKCFHVLRGNFQCVEVTKRFHSSLQIITSMQLQFPYPLLQLPLKWLPRIHGMISMGAWNDFHRYMELLPWVHEIISLGTWNYLLGSMETFQWVPLNSIIYFLQKHIQHECSTEVDRVSEWWSEGQKFKSKKVDFLSQLT